MCRTSAFLNFCQKALKTSHPGLRWLEKQAVDITYKIQTMGRKSKEAKKWLSKENSGNSNDRCAKCERETYHGSTIVGVTIRSSSVTRKTAKENRQTNESSHREVTVTNWPHRSMNVHDTGIHIYVAFNHNGWSVFRSFHDKTLQSS